MKRTREYLALDLGASGGRAIIGRFDGARLTLEEVHRFPNGPSQLPTAYGPSLFWDVLSLFREVKTGIAKAVSASAGELVSVGLDTWGVDFGLLDKAGTLLGNPYHYRDSRTDGMMEEAFRRVPREELFAATGTQLLQLNTLFQLLALAVRDDPTLAAADKLLMMPDLLNYWLTGRIVGEYTIASTSQCLDPTTRDWAKPLLQKLGLPTHIFPPLIQPGTVFGELLPWVTEETGTKGISVVAPGCHDTASAVAAVPAQGTDFAYCSSGTWSLIGMEADQPAVNERSLAFNFTNEGGVCDTIRLLKNIAGLWLIQECRRTWTLEGTRLSWDEIVGLATAAPAFTAVIDVDASDFVQPGDMPARIQTYCARTDQPVPNDKGTIARVVLESLALKYRRVLEMLEELLGYRLGTLHIVGGGTQNRLLSQFAADAVGRPVVTGPIEATAIGNILMQMLATGAIDSLQQGREIVRRSFPTEVFEPGDGAGWDEAYDRFLELTA